MVSHGLPLSAGRRSRLVGLLLGLLAVSGASPGVPDTRAGEPARIDIAYVPPKNAAHRPLYDLLTSKHVLEKIQALLGPFRLPRRVLLKVEGCDGTANAYSGNDAVTVCYEYIDEIWQNVPKETTPEGVAPIDAFAGPLVDVFFHEFGHVVFYMLQVPVFGREEDAADAFSAYLMLNFGYDEARRLIAGAAHQFKRDLKPKVTLKLNDFSDTHGAPATRFYNLLCVAFGANPEVFADIVSKGYLPVERAIGCEDEFRELAHAFKTLIGPHIDESLAKEVMSRHWLPDGMTKPPPRPASAKR
jgi:putative metallopeptidase DUF4344